MTRTDLRIALVCTALVVFLGLAIGYGVGLLTRPDAVALAPPVDGAVPALSQPGPERIANPAGGFLPGYEEIYVNDYADLLDGAAEQRIRDTLKDLYRHTGIEMTVLTIREMAFYGHSGLIEPFATALFNSWGIGNATRNDGVLILISRFDRRMRIELGAGYASEFDARMQRVIDDAFLPRFRQDGYQLGIEQGVDETIREITGTYPGEYDSSTMQRGWSWLGHQARKLGAWVLALLLVPAGGIALMVRYYLRNRPRPCPVCRTVLLRAGETADDEHLDGGQRLEEFLESVDYDVWHCPECSHMDILRYKNWFSSFGACPQCNYYTMSTTSTVLQAATTSSSGRKKLDYHCQHCGFEDTEIRTIPKVTKSSGSGGSSFGGGSSSGGGASGSW